MAGPGVPREQLLEHLNTLIRERERTRASIDLGIRHMRQLEIEMRTRLLAIDRERTRREERFRQDLRRRGELAQEETRLGRELDRAREQLQALADLEEIHQRELEELAHQEQLLLLEYDEKVARAKELLPELPEEAPPAAARAPAGRFDEVFAELPELEEAPPPAPLSPEVEVAELAAEAATPSPAPAPVPVGGELEEAHREVVPPPERPARHCQEGRALWLHDGEGEPCLAFLLGRDGAKAVLSADSFLAYLRKKFRRIGALQQERLKADGAGAASEIGASKDFLARLAGALETGQVAPVLALGGTEVRGEVPQGLVSFEFEKFTEQVLNGQVMALLSQLLRSDLESFFQEEGPYSEIAEYLEGHLEYAKGLDEEERARNLLAQLGSTEPAEVGLDAGPPEAGGRAAEAEVVDLAGLAEEGEEVVVDLGGEGPAGPKGSPERAAGPAETVVHGEHFTDLTTFDFEPPDKKRILEQKEKALTGSGVMRAIKAAEAKKEHAAEAAGAGETAGPPPAPPAPPAEKAPPASPSPFEKKEGALDLGKIEFRKPKPFDLAEVEARLRMEAAGIKPGPEAAPPPAAESAKPPPPKKEGAKKAPGESRIKGMMRDMGLDWEEK